ncbi:MAG: hypothetical protein K8H88_30380 [Sandaracinaceae bacterium]|nr:hypothetical protein [Sandaracinaceae bacterium]
MSRLGVTALAMLIASCSSQSTRGIEVDASQCSDAIDNDGDGRTDCDDPACTVHPWCGGSGVDGGGSPLDAGGSRPDAQIPRFDATSSCSAPLDVVFVIDVSTSMRDEISGIRTGIDTIWTTAQSLTTNTQFSLVVFVDNAVAVNGCAPFATVAAMQTELMTWQSFTSSNGQPNGGPSNSDCAENSLDALHLAATTCPWRTGSTRVVIHITDDTFAERPATLSGVFGIGGIPVQRTYAETVSALVERELRIGAFAAPGEGEYCGAGTSPDVGRGFHDPYLGMPSLPTATGGRAWSIREVRDGSLDMAAAISALLVDEYCTLF